MSNITRAEAMERSALIEVGQYSVELDLGTDLPTSETTFSSRTTVTFTSSTPGASSWIDLIADSVSSVVLNGQSLDPATVFAGNRIQLPSLQAENTLTIDAMCNYMRTGEGLHRFVDPADKEVYLYTQFEVPDARRMFACFEQPDMKASYAFTVTGPSHWQVVSNASSPEPVGARAGMSTWTFPVTDRMSTYITALVAGPYHVVADSYEGIYGTIPLRLYCRTSVAQYLDADDLFLETKQGFEFFERTFQTPYPFGKYDQLMVPEFNAGAMENAGCVTFNENYMIFRGRQTEPAYVWRCNVILHEMAHMWFGDLVTMKWWDDLWLNESFAEFAAYYAMTNATKYKHAWVEFNAARKNWGYRQDQLPSTHPIQADMVDLEAVKANFDGITYAKGASALRQLVAWVGEEPFVAGVREYFSKHAWKNAELKDLLVELEAASGRDLTQWTKEWLQTAGVNTLRAQISDDNGTITGLTVVQEPPSAPEGVAKTLRSHRIGIGLFNFEGTVLKRTEMIEVDVAGARTDIAELVGRKRPDLLLLNDGDFTFAKIRLDEVSTESVAKGLGTIEDPLARALVWSSAWDMARDAEMSTGQYMELVINGMAGETDLSALQTALRNMAASLNLYSAPEKRAAHRTRWAAALHERLLAAESGGDLQLAFLRAFATAAHTKDHADFLLGIFSGGATIEGLQVDTELRWFLIARLAALGAIDEEVISDELSRDDTSNGREAAAVARAAIPTAESKEQAYKEILSPEVSNAMTRSYMQGFWDFDNADIVEPYVERYFVDLPSVWPTKGEDLAEDIGMLMYPIQFVSPALLERTDQFLADNPQLTSGAKRLTRENRDAAVRALKCRAKDAD
jgi:aminopeptidase N